MTDSNSYGDLLFKTTPTLRRLFRDYERTAKKLIKVHWSWTFNHVCEKENILPDYVRLRLHDPALTNSSCTRQYQFQLIRREMEKKEKLLIALKNEKEKIFQDICGYETDVNVKNGIQNALQKILENSDKVQKTSVLKKLNKFYNGQIMLKNEINSFVNLSDFQLSCDEKEFLNLGLNYHIQPKYDKLHKKTELEVLYNSLTDLEKDKKITMDHRIVEQLASESTKHRNPYYRSSIPENLRKAAKELKNNENIVIRKADKSSIYVILNKNDYMDKLNLILSDTSKFKLIRRNPIETIKKKANELISTLNAAQDGIHLQKIVGDYSPGYIYGNVKTHKANNPLRPIISQVPTPTYSLAKSLNKIITPYIPSQYTIKSTNDFIDILHSTKCSGIMASLDVESLFTNVPIDDTIDIIIETVYKHPTILPPKMPQSILKDLLLLCTKEAPFVAPDGAMYRQIEGVAMGSPLGPVFANFYMGYLENKVFKEKENKPSIYVRYVDDIFLQIDSVEQLINLKQLFQENSKLKFTYELSVQNRLPFLDVNVTSSNNKFLTKVCHKPTDSGKCLNANSECIERYKNSVVMSYLNRAYKVSHSWKDFHDEVCNIKQMLINNNYSNYYVDAQIRNFLHKKHENANQTHDDTNTTITLFYNNQMHRNYKIEERMLRSIILNNTKCTEKGQRLCIIFYYKNIKTCNLVMKNNNTSKPSPLCQTNVVYRFNCPMPHCKAENYIGMTQTTLSRRLTYHAQSGSIYKHFKQEHNIKPTRDQLADNTIIIAKANNRYKLAIKEALLILEHAPTINKQFDNFLHTLKLHTGRNLNVNISNNSSAYTNNINQHDEEQSARLSPILQASPELLLPCTLPSSLLISDTTYNGSIMHEPTHDKNNSSNVPLGEYIDGISSCELPDMNRILRRFGISFNSLKEVPVDNYRWQSFQVEELTISQRIKTMLRGARADIVSH